MKKEDYIKDKEMGKVIKLLVNFFILFILFACINKDDNKILDNSYKGFGIFLYHEIDAGSIYEVKFIPFHFKGEKKDTPKNIALSVIYADSNEIIFERGISFNSFREEGILDQIFINSKPCGDTKYCVVYIDFKENEQDVIDKWYKKRGYNDSVCIGKNKFEVTYDPTEMMAKDLIKIKSLNIIK